MYGVHYKEVHVYTLYIHLCLCSIDIQFLVYLKNCLYRVQYLHWTCLKMVIAQGARMELSDCGTQTSNL